MKRKGLPVWAAVVMVVTLAVATACQPRGSQAESNDPDVKEARAVSHCHHLGLKAFDTNAGVICRSPDDRQ